MGLTGSAGVAVDALPPGGGGCGQDSALPKRDSIIHN